MGRSRTTLVRNQVLKTWERDTQKRFLFVTKATVRRVESEGFAGWALHRPSGKEVLILEGEAIRNEGKLLEEVTHELAYEAVREGPGLGVPYLNTDNPMRNAMQWLETVVQHGEEAYVTLRTVVTSATRP